DAATEVIRKPATWGGAGNAEELAPLGRLLLAGGGDPGGRTTTGSAGGMAASERAGGGGEAFSRGHASPGASSQGYAGAQDEPRATGALDLCGAAKGGRCRKPPP